MQFCVCFFLWVLKSDFDYDIMYIQNLYRWCIFMGILEFLQKKRDKENEIDFAVKSENKVEQKEKFVSDLSYIELQSADWAKFAGILKREGVLSNSYDKNPMDINYSIAKDNSPVVELTFQSKTSDSVRKVQLLKEHAYLYVNGKIEESPESQRNVILNKLWRNFQNKLRYHSMLETNREGFAHARRGARLFIESQKMMDMKDIYDREQEFLEKYKDAKFEDFCYSAIFEKDRTGFVNYAGELPKFIPLKETEDGHYASGDPAIPFTPRTLEYCILHMTNGQKIEDGEYLFNFEEKCRKLQKYSCFESEDWDKVIEFGKNFLRKQFISYMITNEMEE